MRKKYRILKIKECQVDTLVSLHGIDGFPQDPYGSISLGKVVLVEDSRIAIAHVSTGPTIEYLFSNYQYDEHKNSLEIIPLQDALEALCREFRRVEIDKEMIKSLPEGRTILEPTREDYQPGTIISLHDDYNNDRILDKEDWFGAISLGVVVAPEEITKNEYWARSFQISAGEFSNPNYFHFKLVYNGEDFGVSTSYSFHLYNDPDEPNQINPKIISKNEALHYLNRETQRIDLIGKKMVYLREAKFVLDSQKSKANMLEEIVGRFAKNK
jgi:hypothetical protein